MTRELREILGAIPSVDRILEDPAFGEVVAVLGRRLAADLVREDLDRLRHGALERPTAAAALVRDAAPAAVAGRVRAAGERVLAPRPAPVLNATGVVVHTNLGRSVLSRPAAERLAETARHFVDLEYDLARGGRGHRQDHLAPLLRILFPGSAGIVVNTNAAAILIALRALARGREVVVSRGELVEIGGSFRVPEILAASGARLREVGTTNRTRVGDYQAALGPRTGAILKVHTSNFRIVGFTEDAGVAELAPLARSAGVPLVVDWGSGDLVDLGPAGIADEVPVGELIADGADVVTFSGDKLLGGPQAGFAVGRPDLIRKMARDPMARVCRIDRIVLAAVHATLRAYVTGRAWEEVPTLVMLTLSREAIAARAQRAVEALRAACPDAAIEVVPGVSRSGGGSSPMGEIPTALIAVTGRGDRAAHRLERRLRDGTPAVIARIHEDRVLLDLRTVPEDSDDTLVSRVAQALSPVRR